MTEDEEVVGLCTGASDAGAEPENADVEFSGFRPID